jgi:hypothetical protein
MNSIGSVSMGPSPTLNKTTNQKKKDVIDYIFHESETHLVFFLQHAQTHLILFHMDETNVF